jgi:hypothetical protein
MKVDRAALRRVGRSGLSHCSFCALRAPAKRKKTTRSKNVHFTEAAPFRPRRRGRYSIPPGKSATTPRTVRLSQGLPGHGAVLCSCPLRQLFLHQTATRQQLRDGLSVITCRESSAAPVWYKRCRHSHPGRRGRALEPVGGLGSRVRADSARLCSRGSLQHLHGGRPNPICRVRVPTDPHFGEAGSTFNRLNPRGLTCQRTGYGQPITQPGSI